MHQTRSRSRQQNANEEGPGNKKKSRLKIDTEGFHGSQPHYSDKESQQLLNLALKRQRKRCEFVTRYNHVELKEWIEKTLRGQWNVLIPKYDKSCPETVSCWPEEGKEMQNVLEALKNKKCRGADDLLDGHCEALALRLSRVTEDLLSKQPEDYEEILTKAQAETLKRLRDDGPQISTEKCFCGGFLSGIVDGMELWDRSVWGERFAQNSIESLLYSNSIEAKKTLKDFCNHVQDQNHVATIPLYVLNYIYDNDELTDDDLTKDHESAQYSCHVVGLVFDGRCKKVLVMDPNGPLWPDSNMEFLAIPLEKRKADQVSTRLSAYEMDRKAQKSEPRPDLSKATKDQIHHLQQCHNQYHDLILENNRLQGRCERIQFDLRCSKSLSEEEKEKLTKELKEAYERRPVVRKEIDAAQSQLEGVRYKMTGVSTVSAKNDPAEWGTQEGDESESSSDSEGGSEEEE